MKESLVDLCTVGAAPVQLYVAKGVADDAWQETRLLLLDDKQVIGHHDFKARVVSVTAQRGRLSLAAVGMSGQVSIATDSGVTFEQIVGPGTGKGRFGYCKRIRSVGDSLFVCGDMRQVYVRHGTDWVRLDDEIREDDPRAVGCSLNDLHGVDESRLVAVGDRGAIYVRRENRWLRCDSPTNVSLERVEVSRDGVAWACGGAGTLMRGSLTTWEVIAAGDSGSPTFWGLALFKDEPYVCGSSGLFRWRDAALESLNVPGLRGAPFRLAADDSALWLLTNSGLWKFDGRTWSEIAT